MSNVETLGRELVRLRAEHAKAKTAQRKATLSARIERVAVRLDRETRRQGPAPAPATPPAKPPRDG